MSLPSVGNRNIDANFTTISKEIETLKRAVNARQEGSSQGIPLKDGDIRFIKGTDGSGYLEVGGKDGTYTTFQGGLQLKGTDTPYAYLHKLFVDNFYAKNIFAQSVRTSNGNLILSDSGVVASATGSTSFVVKNPDGTTLNPFVVGDLLYTAKFSSDHTTTIKELRLDVTAVSGLTVTYTKSSESGTNIPTQVGSLAAGDVLVRLGNNNLATYPERGAVMIFATSDKRDMGGGVKNFAPYVKMLSLVDSYADYFSGIPIAIMGNLGTVTDADFPAGTFLSPSTGTIGHYTSNGFYKGKIWLSDEDLLGDIALGKTYRSVTDPVATYVIRENDSWVDSSTSNRFKTQIWVGNPSDHVSPGAWTAYLPGVWDAPSGAGLMITANYMGYYSTGAFQTYIRDNGSFYFAGYDANHYITWDGTSAELTIAGKVMITNEQDFVKNPVTYVQAADPKLSVTVYEGTLWCDSDGVPVKWYKWIGANSAYSSPGSWEEQPWGTYITGGGIYTGSLTAGQVTAGTFTGLTFQTDTGAVGHYKRAVLSAATNELTFFDTNNVNVVTIGENISVTTPGIGVNEGIIACITSTSSPAIYAYSEFAGGVTMGVQATGKGSTTNYGVSGTASGAGTTNYGLYGTASGATTNWAGYFDGNVYLSGQLEIGTASPFIVNSSGNITKLNNVAYSFPSVAPTLNQVLTCTNATGGVLSWSTPSSMVYPGAGIALSTGSAWGTSITDNSANWNTAYGWGNHASAGYLTAAVTAINGSTAGSHSISAGNGVLVSSVGAVHTISAKAYSATGITVDANGIGISAGNGLGNSANQLVAVVTAPLTFATGSISMPAAATAQNGYLTSTDWNTFNGKATASYGTPGVTDYEIAVVGGGSILLTPMPTTINGTLHTLYMVAE